MIECIMVHRLDLAMTCKKKVRLIYVYEKAAVLILWRCGDVERNPGPSPSDTIRAVAKVIISSLVVEVMKRTRNVKSKQADYKTIPDGWNKGLWYGDPSKATNNERNEMLQGLLGVYQVNGNDIPEELQTGLKMYQTVVDKQGSKQQREHNFKDLQTWLERRRFCDSVDQMFENLSELPENSQNFAVEYIARKMSISCDLLTKVCKMIIVDENTYDCAVRDGTITQQTEGQIETGSASESPVSSAINADSSRNRLTVPDPSNASQMPAVVLGNFGNDSPIGKRKSQQMTDADLEPSTVKRQKVGETSRHDGQPPATMPCPHSGEDIQVALPIPDIFDDLKDVDYDVKSLQETGNNLKQFVEDAFKDNGPIY